MRKPFSENLSKWALSAEIAIKEYLQSIGYRVIHHPHGIYGKDCECMSETERFFVEVERRSNLTWDKATPFPYRTVTIPERRIPSNDTLLFIVRFDLLAALVVFPTDISSSPLETRANRFMPNGNESFRSVLTCRCLPLDLSIAERATIADRSVDCFLRRWKDAGKSVIIKSELLGRSPPYGISYSQWCQYLVEVSDSFNDALDVGAARPKTIIGIDTPDCVH